MTHEERLDALLDEWEELLGDYLDMDAAFKVLSGKFGLSREGLEGSRDAVVKDIIHNYPLWPQEQQAAHPYQGWPIGLWCCMVAFFNGAYKGVPEDVMEDAMGLVGHIHLELRGQEVIH